MYVYRHKTTPRTQDFMVFWGGGSRSPWSIGRQNLHGALCRRHCCGWSNQPYFPIFAWKWGHLLEVNPYPWVPLDETNYLLVTYCKHFSFKMRFKIPHVIREWGLNQQNQLGHLNRKLHMQTTKVDRTNKIRHGPEPKKGRSTWLKVDLIQGYTWFSCHVSTFAEDPHGLLHA